MRGDESSSGSDVDMDDNSSDSGSEQPKRVQRKASVASRAGIKKSAKADSESDDASNFSDESGSEDNSSDGSDSFADEDAEESDTGKKRKSAPKKRVVAKPKKVVKKVTKKASPAKKNTKSGKSSQKSTPASKSAKSSAKPSTAKRSRKDSDDEDNSDDGGDNDQMFNEQRVMRTVSRSPKEQLVAELLCRWWYVMPDWPPADFDYGPKLAKENLRLVTLDKWEDEPDTDSNGRLKCYALSQYKGLYRDANQQLRDLRPIEGKPSFSECIRKSEKELISLIVQAINKQIEILSQSSERNTEPIMADLKEKLKSYTKRK